MLILCMVFKDGGVFLLINFLDDFNNIKMMCHKKSILTDICKQDYYLCLLHELIRNASGRR